MRTARASGYDDDRIRDMLAGNANRIADGEEPLEPTAATGSDIFSQPMVLARIHQYLSMATPLLWTRQPDTSASRPRPERLRGERRRRPELDRIRELLLCARDLWREVPEIEDERDRMRAIRHTFRLIHLADIVAVTPGVFSRDESRSRT